MGRTILAKKFVREVCDHINKVIDEYSYLILMRSSPKTTTKSLRNITNGLDPSNTKLLMKPRIKSYRVPMVIGHSGHSQWENVS